MHVEIITKNDLLQFKNELLTELSELFQKTPKTVNSRFLKSSEVKSLLGCSHGTLQTLRINGTLPYSRIRGTIYYDIEDVNKILEKNKQNAA